MVDPDFPKRGHQPNDGDAYLILFEHITPENCVKLDEIWLHVKRSLTPFNDIRQSSIFREVYAFSILFHTFRSSRVRGGINIFQSGKYLQRSKRPISKTHLSLEIYFVIKATYIIGCEGHWFCANKIGSRLVTLKLRNYRWKRSSWVRNHRSCRTSSAVRFPQARPSTVSSPD